MKKKKENQANSESGQNVEKINVGQNTFIELPADAESKGDNNYDGENAILIGNQVERNSKADVVY